MCCAQHFPVGRRGDLTGRTHLPAPTRNHPVPKKEERQESHVVKDLGQEKASGSDDAVFESAVIAESNERSHYICAARRGAMG